MRSWARRYGWARVAFGAALVAAPTPAARLWIGDLAATPEVRSPLRGLAVRDLALGLAVVWPRNNPRARREALLLCALVDAGDAVLSGAEYARTKRVGAGITALGALGAAGVALWASTRG